MRIMHERGDGYTLYFGRKKGTRYVGFTPRLHSGFKGKWEYFQPAFSSGRLFMNCGKWYMLPEMKIPASVTHLWRKRHKSYRDGFKVEESLDE